MQVMGTVYNMFEGMGQRPAGDPKAGENKLKNKPFQQI
jgi:hypothetical protein